MNKKTVWRKVNFNNQEVMCDLLTGDDSSNLVIFLHPDPVFGGSMNEPVIQNMFAKCRERNIYGVRVQYLPGSVERLILQTVIVIEEAKLFFSSIGNSMFNIWLVGLSIGASVAFKVLQRRIDIHGIVMISPILKYCESSENDKNNKIFLCYSDTDALNPAEGFVKYIAQLKPIASKCFSGANHTMTSHIEELSQYVIDEIIYSCKY